MPPWSWFRLRLSFGLTKIVDSHSNQRIGRSSALRSYNQISHPPFLTNPFSEFSPRLCSWRKFQCKISSTRFSQDVACDQLIHRRCLASCRTISFLWWSRSRNKRLCGFRSYQTGLEMARLWLKSGEGEKHFPAWSSRISQSSIQMAHR